MSSLGEFLLYHIPDLDILDLLAFCLTSPEEPFHVKTPVQVL